MVNYQNGKIYKITGTNNEGVKLIYIGSTVQKLCVRLAEHKRDVKHNKYMSSSLVLMCNDYEITLIELYPCKSKEELLMRERYYYDMFDCVNQQKPILLEGEIIEYHKQYRIENADKRNEYNKQYRIENTDTISEKSKQYYIENADAISEKHKQYYIENADKRIEYTNHYRVENADAIREYKKQYYIKNKDKILKRQKQYKLKNKTL